MLTISSKGKTVYCIQNHNGFKVGDKIIATETMCQFHSSSWSEKKLSELNGYKAFYKGKELEVYAETSYAAQLDAAKQFKAKKSYDVSVFLCELKGKQVSHTTNF